MPLVVYKSSAGSGKTSTLVREYLKLTLDNPWQFRNVLAITFTNKAANEMKERVLNALRLMVAGKTEEEDELKELKNELSIPEEELREKAGKLLTAIIHDYDEFAVSTIDSFVHGIIKTFATDIKLPQNFEVVLDKDDIIPEIVQNLYDKVGVDKDVTNILVNFVIANYEEEKGHDPTNQIYGFIEKQIEEQGFHYITKLLHLSLADFHRIISRLEETFFALKEKIKKAGKEGYELFQTAGVEQAWVYQGKSGIYGYFSKIAALKQSKDVLPNSYVRTTIGEDKWYSGKCPPEQKPVIDSIKDKLVQKYETIQAMAHRYLMYGLLHRKIYDVALIKEIRQLFDDYAADNQKVHISEFNKKISETISGQPVPFIYERLGRKYTHFLIDEFQDTSILQWQNFLPLIEESLAYGRFNMLVGDAKQAIYRFRNGEVELFANLPELYPEAVTPGEKTTEQLLKSQYKEVVLESNYRSDREIVAFNNRFFEAVKQGMSEKIKKVYDHHTQLLPEKEDKSGGFVRIDLLEAEDAANYREKRLQQILANVRQLQDKAYRKKDICILTNQNKYAVEIASFLIANGYAIVSSESLLLKNAPEVRMIIAFLRLLLQQDDHVQLAAFIRNLLLVYPKHGSFHDVYSRSLPLMKKSVEAMLNDLGYGNVKENEMNGMSAYELTEYAMEKFFGSSNNNVFVHYFLDFVLENQHNGDGSLDAFLSHWDKKSDKAFIAMPEGKDAVRIMTIHKAKGLKFESVIVDFIPRNDTITKKEYWTDLDLPELKELKAGMYPVVKELNDVGLGHIYDEEAEKTELDLLNMVYVAFTRPVSALFIVSHRKGKKQNKFTAYIDAFLRSENVSPDAETWELGQLRMLKTKKDDEEANAEELKDMRSSSWKDLVTIARVDDVTWERMSVKKARTYGNLVHKMLSEITYAADVAPVVASYEVSGLLDAAEADKLRIKLEKLVQHNELRAYFTEGVQVRNESELVKKDAAGATFQRPDRVVIAGDELVLLDYKTGAREEEHKRQITGYAALFDALGYRNIKKLLVYINDDVEVVTV